MMLSLMFAFMSSVSFASDDCATLFNKHGLEKEASEIAIACYEHALPQALTSQAKADVLNHLSQLHFFMSTAEDQKNAESRLDRATRLAEQSCLLFGSWLDEQAYLKLPDGDRTALSVALYDYGVALARLSELQGALVVVSKWPTIQRVMKLVMKLGHPDVAGYGAHRTLAIANTRMPAPFGDKKLAEQYLKFAIQKSDKGGFSSYLVNHTMLADLYFRLDRNTEACAQLSIAAKVDEIALRSNSEAGIYENFNEKKIATTQLKEKCGQ